MIPPSKPPANKPHFRGIDLALVGAVALTLAIALYNAMTNMQALGIGPGFGFLSQAAGFDVSESLIPYGPNDSYARVIVTGVVNTLFLSLVCLVLSTLLGLVFGLVSVGPSPIGRSLALAYVEFFRNLPKLLVLLILFVAAVNGLPHVREAISLGPFHLSNRSLNFPVLVLSMDLLVPIAALCVATGLVILCSRGRERWSKRVNPGLPRWLWLVPPALSALSIFALDVPIELSVPQLKGFDFQGGGRLSMQFVVIAATLSIYHGAQIAEVVRGGLQAVPGGQTEAARSLGLTPWQTVRLVVLPQVVRIVVPPMNNQYVNLIKNTSIAIAVGYSDLMSVSGTIINQTFRPLEMMIITMAIYLSVCVVVTTSLNRFHQRLTSREAR